MCKRADFDTARDFSIKINQVEIDHLPGNTNKSG